MVTIGPPIDQTWFEAKISEKYQRWIAHARLNFAILRDHILAATFTPHGLLFAFTDCEVRDTDGNWVPGQVLIRGDAIAVLVKVVDSETGAAYAVLTEQPRFAVGDPAFREIPAGMMDDEKNFAGVTAREIKEETGLVIREGKLQSLGFYYSSPGVLDEAVHLFFIAVSMSPGAIRALQEKASGLPGEKITLRLVPFHELPQHAMTDPKAQIAWARYMDLLPTQKD